MNAKQHSKAIAVLKTLSKNELVILEYEDNFASDQITDVESVMRQIEAGQYRLKTVGFYQRHDANHVIVSSEILEKPTDRSQISGILTKYLIRVTKLREA